VFYIYTKDVHNSDNDNVTYVTSGLRAEGKPSLVVVDSAGVGYSEIPPAVGLYKRTGDRAKTVVTLTGTSVSGVTISSGGVRSVIPTPIFFDAQGFGSVATGTAIVENGVVTEIVVTDGGTGYREPVLECS